MRVCAHRCRQNPGSPHLLLLLWSPRPVVANEDAPEGVGGDDMLWRERPCVVVASAAAAAAAATAYASLVVIIIMVIFAVVIALPPAVVVLSKVQRQTRKLSESQVHYFFGDDSAIWAS